MARYVAAVPELYVRASRRFSLRRMAMVDGYEFHALLVGARGTLRDRKGWRSYEAAARQDGRDLIDRWVKRLDADNEYRAARERSWEKVL